MDETSRLEPRNSLTWKDGAGRAEGPDGYQFGDVTRTVASKTVAWAHQPKQHDGYEFGDIFLKTFVRCASTTFGTTSPPAEDPPSEDIESQAHQDIAAQLNADMRKARELLEKYIPMIENRLKELEGNTDKTAIELSEEYRIKAGCPGAVGALDSYSRCLKELSGTQWGDNALNATFVRVAEEGGELENIKECLKQALTKALECEKCANDVCRQHADPELSSNAVLPEGIEPKSD